MYWTSVYHNYTDVKYQTELVDESLSSPPSVQPVSPQPELGLESLAGPSTQPLDGPSAAPPATEVRFKNSSVNR
jgi:hypothetical protein